MKNIMQFIAATIVLCCLVNLVSAQDLPGKKDSINSVALGQKRFIQIVLPPGYKPGSTDKYDVIYVTDGDDNTKTMADVQAFVSREGFMPKVIIVGVLNIDRSKDLTPTHVNDNETSGGGEKFLAFFRDELIPYINKTYSTSGDNVLFGHSLGGLFVTYVLLNQPQVFKSYIAADPSYWWDKSYLLGEATKKLPLLAGQRKSLYISGREGQGMREMSINPMDIIFQKYAPANIAWKITAYANETHGTIRLKTIYDGLKFIYSGYRSKPPEFHPMAGIILKDKPIRVWDFDDDTTMVRYTIDGSAPTTTSPNIKKVNMLSGPGTVTARVFTINDRYDKTTTGIFKEGKALPPSKLIKGFKPGGLHYAYYEGEWDKLPDFSKLRPVKEGWADSSFAIGKLPRKTNFGLVLSGQMEAKEDGYYVFADASDDGSRFYLNNQLLLDDDGLHDDSGSKSYIIPLKKGFYPVRVEYFQKDGGMNLLLICFPPKIAASDNPRIEPIPLKLLYSVH
jgi:predicted alpha/beta superfamily hydrolase